MIIQLNFDKTKLKTLVGLIRWMKSNGIITSFKIEKSELEEEEESDYEISDEEADEILTAFEDVEAGNYVTHEELLKSLNSKNG